jgi:hypothetical protein
MKFVDIERLDVGAGSLGSSWRILRGRTQSNCDSWRSVAPAVRYDPNLLKGIIRFRKLERFTLYYSRDIDARRQWAEDYKHNLTLELMETLG